jgi:putative flippase GtrA
MIGWLMGRLGPDPWRVVRFALVGGISTLIYSVFAYVFTVNLHMAAVLGSVLAYLMGAIFSYNAHRRITFRSNRPVRHEAPRFAGISFAGWIVAILSPLIFTDAWGLPPVVAILFASVAVPIMSFLGMERFVFRRQPTGATSREGLAIDDGSTATDD